MKITNRNYGYIEKFECNIDGKITMSQKEWYQVVRKCFERLSNDSFYRDILIDDLGRRIYKPTRGFLVSVRVPLTEMIVDTYGLDKYKRGNYMMEVLP